jgi:hypothetical protein
MNAQTQRVDVLHAIGQADVALAVAGLSSSDIFRVELRAASKAIAELIAAVELGGDLPRKTGSDKAGMFFTAANAERLRAAVARVGGAQP